MGLGVANLADVLAQVNMSTAQRYASALTPVRALPCWALRYHRLARGGKPGLTTAFSSVSATEATPAFPASPATGDVKDGVRPTDWQGVGASDVSRRQCQLSDRACLQGLAGGAESTLRICHQTDGRVHPALVSADRQFTGLLLTRWSPPCGRHGAGVTRFRWMLKRAGDRKVAFADCPREHQSSFLLHRLSATISSMEWNICASLPPCWQHVRVRV